MPPRWTIDEKDLTAKLQEARKAGSTRLFAIAYDRITPVQWHHRKDEAEMQKFLDSREESESILFNCAIAVVVVNPKDSEETVFAIIAAGNPRVGQGPGFFSESF
jgi:hypothetical protein